MKAQAERKGRLHALASRALRMLCWGRYRGGLEWGPSASERPPRSAVVAVVCSGHQRARVLRTCERAVRRRERRGMCKYLASSRQHLPSASTG